MDPGTYLEAIDFLGKDILVGSRYVMTGDTTHVRQTIIDGSGVVNTSVVRFTTLETRSSRLAGFTVTGGLAIMGGGIYCYETSPTLDHLRVVDNTALIEGGGIYSFKGEPLVSECWITDNWALDTDGGGIWAQFSWIVIDRNEIHSNHAGFRGAGIFCEHSWQTITDNKITGNVIEALPPAYCYGGGIVSRNCSPIISGNYVFGNDGGGDGGGIFY